MRLRICLLLCLACCAARADLVSFDILVDTSPLAFTSGFLSFQLNPGASDALFVKALAGNVRTDGQLEPVSTDTGDAAGTLPATLVLGNTTSFNEVFQQITFQDFFDVSVCLCGPGIGGQALTGTTFSLSIYDAAGVNPLLTTNPEGSLLHIDVNPDGSVVTSAFADATGVTRSTIDPLAECPIPEPSSAVLLLSAATFSLLLFLARGARSRLRSAACECVQLHAPRFAKQ